MEAKQKRIDWVDTGKFFCIMFVMLSHLESGSAALEKFYTPFFLSMFFFLSGYVYRDPGSFREHVKKKVRTLLWPWFVFSMFNICLTYVTPFVNKEGVWKRFIWAFIQIRGLEDATWFVAALFVAFLPFYFFARAKKPLLSTVIAFALSLGSMWYCDNVPGEWLPWGVNALPWHLESIFQFMFWMLLGYYFRRWGEDFFDRRNTLWTGAVLWGAYLLVIYVPGLGMPYIPDALGILAVMWVCKAMKSNRYIRFVGRNTLTYFALHGRVYALVELGLKLLAGGFYAACLADPWTSSVLAVAVTVVVSLILVIPAEIINRWLPWVLGRKKVKNAV